MFGSWLGKVGVSAALVGSQLVAEQMVLPGKLTLSPENVQELAETVSPQSDSSGECCPSRHSKRNATPSARGCPCNSGNPGFFTTSEFLYWQGTETDLWIAYKNTNAVNPLTNPNREGKYERINFDWDPGFRVGIGYNLPHDGWDLYANYTWYLNNSTSVFNSEISSPIGLVPTLVPNLSTITGTSPILYGRAKANWRLNYNFFDLELGRSFFVSRGAAVRPFAGIRGGWLNRRLGANFSNGLVVVTNLPNFILGTPVMDENYSRKIDTWGVGPRIGLDGKWNFISHFSLFSDLAASILYGKSFSTASVIQSSVPFQTGLTLFHAVDENWRVLANLQILLGVGWGKCFNCNRNYFSLDAGWEINQWWNLDKFIIIGGVGPLSANVTLQGLTVTAKLDF